MNVELIKQNVGIDVSKDDFEVCLSVINREIEISKQGSHCFANNPSGFEKLLQWLDKKSVKDLSLSFTMEATGVYYESLAWFLFQNGFRVHVVLPVQAKKYIQSLGIKLKTDKTDAQYLSHLGLERSLRVWSPLSTNMQTLRQLTRERETIVRDRTSVSNQLHAYQHQGKPNQGSIARAKEQISVLDRQVKEIEKEIAILVKQDEVLQTKLNYIQSIPGIGLITAAVIVAETNGFTAITSIKQLTSFAGMDITIAESGKWKGRSKISKKGNSHIRRALYMPTLTKIKKDKSTQNYYQRLKDKKGKGMIAVVALQRKLLGLMYTLWKKEQIYVSPAV